MVYVVGVPDAHLAIGTSAIAVAANAAFNLSNHARGGTVRWSCALPFAAAGMVGAYIGSIFGKELDGQHLLALFAMVMLVIAALMLKARSRDGLPNVKMSSANLPAILGLGLATGTLSGFFGIGGGFLIVPALMLATGMSIMNAVSSSLVAVTAFGLTTAASYAYSGLVSWQLAGLFIAGGVVGGLIGTNSARFLSTGWAMNCLHGSMARPKPPMRRTTTATFRRQRRARRPARFQSHPRVVRSTSIAQT